jgi:histidinol phosphatase-like PHP family hydrolase
MVYDFHTHTIHSDGSLLPIELIRRAVARGYRAIGITDHASVGNLEHVIRMVVGDCRLAEQYWDVRAVPGVELTHLPPEMIPEVAAEARRQGAKLVLAHGETPVEPVPPGTNLAALECPDVDVLAHPGPIDAEAARLAESNGIFLEISAHRGHCLANGAVAAAARAVGALLLVGSDAHDPDEILTPDAARTVAVGAGVPEAELERVLRENPEHLLARIAGR